MTLDEFLQQIEGNGSAVDEEIITDLESELDEHLPSDYRQFLNLCKGGAVKKDIRFAIPPDRFSHIESVGGDVQNYWLTNLREIYWGRIPESLLWIMGDVHGNAICLAVAGECRGQVFFWDAEKEFCTDAAPVLLANTFTEFVMTLN